MNCCTLAACAARLAFAPCARDRFLLDADEPPIDDARERPGRSMVNLSGPILCSRILRPDLEAALASRLDRAAASFFFRASAACRGHSACHAHLSPACGTRSCDNFLSVSMHSGWNATLQVRRSHWMQAPPRRLHDTHCSWNRAASTVSSPTTSSSVSSLLNVAPGTQFTHATCAHRRLRPTSAVGFSAPPSHLHSAHRTVLTSSSMSHGVQYQSSSGTTATP
mmetsp:Transcript_14312/g.49735  ORF Transcript_14312/g.49735 Transcript_14312/m.49735 type:complete len:223 (-) Transcript_14312:508-1176(-)